MTVDGFYALKIDAKMPAIITVYKAGQLAMVHCRSDKMKILGHQAIIVYQFPGTRGELQASGPQAGILKNFVWAVWLIGVLLVESPLFMRGALLPPLPDSPHPSGQ